MVQTNGRLSLVRQSVQDSSAVTSAVATCLRSPSLSRKVLSSLAISAGGGSSATKCRASFSPMCRAVVLPTHGRNDSVANDGMPPVRSGHMVASSARQKQRKQPAIVITPMRMMASAPVPCTAYGAMPVTRIVPASPITKAPHQLVPLARPCSGCASCIEAIAPPRPETSRRASGNARSPSRSRRSARCGTPRA